MTKLIIYCILSAMFLLLPAVSIYGGEHHPDGIIGQANGYISFHYSKASPEPNVLIDDHTAVDFGLNIPSTRKFTFTGSAGISFGDTTYYNFTVGGKFYLGNPVGIESVNPDGAIGAPVFSISGGAKISELDAGNPGYFADFGLLVPLSSNLSLGAGYTWYELEDIYRVREFYGILNIFPVRYEPGRAYENPDGVEGVPSLYLRGGGSKNGVFGRLDLMIPISSQSTLDFYMQGERAAAPYVRIATVGARINFYPGQ